MNNSQRVYSGSGILTPIRILVALLVVSFPRTGLSEDITFSNVTYSSLSQPREVEAIVSLADAKILIKGRKPGKKAKPLDKEISYASIVSMSYQPATRHRIGEGGALAGLSLGAGSIVMATKTTSYWLDIHYRDGDAKCIAILRLDKSDYQRVLAAMESKSGKPITTEDSRTANELFPTRGSKNVDEVVPFEMEKVLAALKPAMESQGCSIRSVKKDRIECKRAREYSERTGGGAEKVTARLKAKGAQTRVRIETHKGMLGRLLKRNWSTPIYQAMLRNLHPN